MAEQKVVALDLLKALSGSQFQEVLFRYGAEQSILPTTTQSETAIELIKLAEQKEGKSLAKLLAAIYTAAPHLKGQMSPVQAFLDSLSNKYEIIDLVGEGNLAQIYKARDKDMNRIVSIKLLRHQNKELMDAFDKSARKAIEISDEPNFLTIYDVHLEDSQHHYYVRQFIQGHDWGQDLRKYMNTWIESNDGGLPLERIRKIILEIGGALDKAHRKVKKPYRYTDIKPSNVLLSNDFETFISSFNICAGFEPKKIIGEFERKDEIQKDCPDFDENLLHEELSYLLPDHFYQGQIADKDVPAYEKTDQYMLGLLAYELLTGKIPPTLICLDELKDKGFDAFRQIDSIPRADCPEIVKNVILIVSSRPLIMILT
jgi:serine/threonine-protein kinase